MIDTKRKEEISKSYLNAVCAASGITMETKQHDDDGIDAILQKTIYISNGTRYNAQIGASLKSTSIDLKEDENYYHYPLKKKNYDELRMPSTVKPYLFLLVLPIEENEWLTQSIEQLVIRKCMFWLDLKELPDSDNSSNVTVLLPKTNIVSSETLDEMLKKDAEEALL